MSEDLFSVTNGKDSFELHDDGTISVTVFSTYIDNSGTLELTADQTRQLYKALRKQLKKKTDSLQTE